MSNEAAPMLARGVYAALATPRRRDSVEADTAAYLEYLDKISQAGVDGLVFFGSTGEFVHYDLPERMRVVSLAAKRSRIPVLVNVSHSTFSGARDVAEQAIEAEVAGVLLMPPYFYPCSDAEIRAFYQSFASALGGRIPIYLYNLPAFTTPISKPVLIDLLSSGAFAGIKDSSGDWDNFTTLAGIRAEHPFQLLAGHEGIYTRALQCGADGIVSGIAAAVPELIVALQRSAAAGGIASPELAARMNEFLSWIGQFPPTLAIKEAVEARHWFQTTAASPLAPETEERLRAFRSWLESWLPATLELSKP